MNKAFNFFKQAQEAAEWSVSQNQMFDRYEREHPKKISRFGDEITLQDNKHFKKWKKEKG